MLLLLADGMVVIGQHPGQRVEAQHFEDAEREDCDVVLREEDQGQDRVQREQDQTREVDVHVCLLLF